MPERRLQAQRRPSHHWAVSARGEAKPCWTAKLRSKAVGHGGEAKQYSSSGDVGGSETRGRCQSAGCKPSEGHRTTGAGALVEGEAALDCAATEQGLRSSVAVKPKPTQAARTKGR